MIKSCRPVDWMPPCSSALDGVSLWFLDLDVDAELASRCLEVLSADEEERRRRFDRPVDARNFAVGRAILRALMAERLRCRPAEVGFERGPDGKPSVAGGEAHFSFSRSAGHALVAISSQGPLGVDLERDVFMDDAVRLARRRFTARESRLVDSSERAHETFLRIWTRKEALLKALGRGLTVPLDSVEVLPLDGDAIEPTVPVTSEDSPPRWSLSTLPIEPGWFAAIATCRKHAPSPGLGM